MEYEKILADIGGFGRIQFFLFLLLSFTNFKACADIQLLVLCLFVPKFRCLENSTVSNISSLLSNSSVEFDNKCTVSSDYKNSSIECTKFHYQKEVFSRTLVEEFDLVCSRAGLQQTMLAVFFLGSALGMLIGTLGDKVGRKRLIVFLGFWDIISSILPIFAGTIELQLASRFLKGVPAAVYYQSLLLLEELTLEKHRAILGNLYWLFWCLGFLISGPLVALLKDWRLVQWISILPCGIYVFIWWLVPESPRWLVLRGQRKEAENIFRWMANKNSISLPTDYFHRDIEIENEATGRVKDICMYPNMRLKTFICVFMLSSFSFSYYGLSMDSTFTTSNIVLNQVFTGLVEIPSSFIGWILSDRLGRKLPTLVMTVISGFGVIIVFFLPLATLSTMRTIVAMASKCLLTAAYCIMDLYATEIFPTSIRNNGLFFATFLATICNVIAPFISSLADVAVFLPGIVFGGTSIVSSLLLLILPETKGLPLPDTVHNGEGMIRGREKIWALEQLRRERGEAPLLDKEDGELTAL